MASAETPFSYLPLSVFGLLAGLGLALGSGVLLHEQWTGRGDRIGGDGQMTIEGSIVEARWRRSAVSEGPNQYLQIRITGDDRAFLIAEQDLFPSALNALGMSEARNGRIPGIAGKRGRVSVDSALADEKRPYLAALQIDGRVVGAQEGRAVGSPASWKSWMFALFFGTGVLAGVGLMSVSIHHLVVCVRYRRRRR